MNLFTNLAPTIITPTKLSSSTIIIPTNLSSSSSAPQPAFSLSTRSFYKKYSKTESNAWNGFLFNGSGPTLNTILILTSLVDFLAVQ